MRVRVKLWKADAPSSEQTRRVIWVKYEDATGLHTWYAYTLIRSVGYLGMNHNLPQKWWVQFLPEKIDSYIHGKNG